MSHNGTNGSQIPSDDLNQQGVRVQELVARVEELPDPVARELLQDCMEAVVSFYGKGLARILDVVRNPPGHVSAFEALAQDEVVRGFLLIHGLHPVEQKTRLEEALAKVRPYLQSHGGNVELISLANDFAQLRLVGHCRTCPSSTVTLELAVRQAIEEACPDLSGFQVEGVEEGGAKRAPGESDPEPAQWNVVPGAIELTEGELISVRASGVSLLIGRVEGALYAYRDRCPACNMPLHLGVLIGGRLCCRSGHHYDFLRAGHGLNGTEQHLEPFPLLVEEGVVRVALAGDVSSVSSPIVSEVS